MGAFLPEADGRRGAGFAISSGLLFAVLTMLWLLAARGDRAEYRRSSLSFRHRDGCVRHPAGCHRLLGGQLNRIPAWGVPRRRLPGRIRCCPPEGQPRGGGRPDDHRCAHRTLRPPHHHRARRNPDRCRRRIGKPADRSADDEHRLGRCRRWLRRLVDVLRFRWSPAT